MSTGKPRYRIAVLLGGVSAERPISIKSGRAVAQALETAGHEVLPVDIDAECIDPVIELRPDVAFIALHGRFGEDGGVQSLLDDAGIPYTGSSSNTSRVAMDKMASKCYFMSHDVPTPDFRLVTFSRRPGRQALSLAVEELGLPVVVKPLGQGSSLGVTVAGTLEEVSEGLKEAVRYDEQAILERHVIGREITVGVLGNEALPIIELRYPGRLFDYRAKYESDETVFIVNPDLTQQTAQRAQVTALLAHRALGCSGFSRVDMIVDREGLPYVLEVNTIPGMTKRSLFPMAAAEAGIGFPELCDRLVRMAALAREPLGVLA